MLISLASIAGETSLKCYYCLEPCKLTNAREKICGENIGKSHEAVCTSEISKSINTLAKHVLKRYFFQIVIIQTLR